MHCGVAFESVCSFARSHVIKSMVLPNGLYHSCYIPGHVEPYKGIMEHFKMSCCFEVKYEHILEPDKQLF